MTREEYTIRGAHVGGGVGIQDPGMLALGMHLIECSDKTVLVPHGSWWRDVERPKCRGGLRRREGCVSLRRRGAKHAWAPAGLLSRRRALWRPWIVAKPGAHGAVLTNLANAAALLRRAAVPAPALALALALALAAAAVATAAALGAAVAGHVWVVWTSRVGCGSESTAPARAGAARAGGGKEGGAGDRLFVIGETELL